MSVTPSEIFELALFRHRQPWNWTFHLVALFCFMLTLLFHSYLMLAVTLIFFGGGFYELGLADMPDNWWHGVIRKAVEWEKDWIAYPWTFGKCARFFFVLLVLCVLIWALWTGDAIVLGMFMGFAYLLRVMVENKSGGIDL